MRINLTNYKIFYLILIILITFFLFKLNQINASTVISENIIVNFYLKFEKQYLQIFLWVINLLTIEDIYQYFGLFFTKLSFLQFFKNLFIKQDCCLILLIESKIIIFTEIIFFPFIGGLILNLMPCVFPFLAIKILSFIEKSKNSTISRFLHGCIFTLGILISFWILGILIFFFKFNEKRLGWGFQLQEPKFIIFLIILFFILSLNYLGLLKFISDFKFTQLKSIKNKKYYSTFFSGVILVLTTTPCTAPFTGAAIGFSLGQPFYISIIILTNLGIGMAAPYLLLSLLPRYVTFLPKPGPWMKNIKRIMAIPLLVTVFWLIWILNLQINNNEQLILLIVILFISSFVIFFIFFIAKNKQGKIIYKKTIFSLLLTVIVLYISLNQFKIHIKKYYEHNFLKSHKNNLIWHNYSAKYVKKLHDQGCPIYIDFTAAWCITCQINKRIFNSKDIINRFIELNIIPIKGDWTNRNISISEALAKFNRVSVPLNVLYTNKSNKLPIILPAILTKKIILEHIEKAF